MKCPDCSSSIRARDVACQHCGRWLAAVHPICGCVKNEEAVGVCVVCGAPVCASCASYEGPKIVCREASHRSLARTHVECTVVESIFDADWVCMNLKQQGVESCAWTLRNHPGMHGLDVPSTVRILVPRERLANANDILRSILLDTEKKERS